MAFVPPSGSSQSGVVTFCASKLFFRENLVEGDSASFRIFPSVGNAAVLQDFLDLPVFAECSVERDEGEIDIVRQFEVGIVNVDFRDDLRLTSGALLPRRLQSQARHHAPAGPAHQNRDILCGKLFISGSPTICTSVSNSMPRLSRACPGFARSVPKLRQRSRRRR